MSKTITVDTGGATEEPIRVALSRVPPQMPVEIISEGGSDYDLARTWVYLKGEKNPCRVSINGRQWSMKIPPPDVYRVTAQAWRGTELSPVAVHEEDRVVTIPADTNAVGKLRIRLGTWLYVPVDLEVEIAPKEAVDSRVCKRMPQIAVMDPDGRLRHQETATNTVTVVKNLVPTQYVVRVTSPYFKTREKAVDFGKPGEAARVRMDLEWRRKALCRFEGVAKDEEVWISVISNAGEEHWVSGNGNAELAVFLPEGQPSRLVWSVGREIPLAWGAALAPAAGKATVRIDAREALPVRCRVEMTRELLGEEGGVELSHARLISPGDSSRTSDAELALGDFEDRMLTEGMAVRLTPGPYRLDLHLLRKGMTPTSPFDFLVVSKSFTVGGKGPREVRLLFDRSSITRRPAKEDISDRL